MTHISGLDANYTPLYLNAAHGEEQHNPPHFMEIESAMAIRSFWQQPASERFNEIYLKGMELKMGEITKLMLGFTHLTCGEMLKKKISAFLNLALLFDLFYYPRFFVCINRFDQNYMPQLDEFIRPLGEEEAYKQCTALRDFFYKYIVWCRDIAENLQTENVTSTLFSSHLLSQALEKADKQQKTSEATDRKAIKQNEKKWYAQNRDNAAFLRQENIFTIDAPQNLWSTLRKMTKERCNLDHDGKSRLAAFINKLSSNLAVQDE
jgi:hypothetical protein